MGVCGAIIASYSAGVGRTGTLMTIDIALSQAARENVIDIAGIVCKIRSQRMKLVQTPVSIVENAMSQAKQSLKCDQ